MNGKVLGAEQAATRGEFTLHGAREPTLSSFFCVAPGRIRNERFGHLLSRHRWLQVSVQRAATASSTTLTLFFFFKKRAGVLRVNGVHLHMKGSSQFGTTNIIHVLSAISE